MARRNKVSQSVIFDDDATLIIQSDTPPEEQKTKKQRRVTGLNIPVVDILDAIAGFTMPTFDMIRNSEDNGTCIVCGKQTAYQMRKLCVDCMKEHGRDYYEKARAAIEKGESAIKA